MTSSLATLAVSSAAENRTLALLFLGLVPFLLACWGLAHLLAGPERRRIARNLTPAERHAFESRAASYGRQVVLYVGAPLGVACGATYYLTDSGPATSAVLATGLLIALPLFARLSRPLRDSLLRTEPARHRSDG